MLSVPAFIEQYDVLKSDPLGKTKWHESLLSAISHTQRRSLKEFFEIQRPYESDEIREYREQIMRNITMEVPDKWLSKTTRLIQYSGVGKDNLSISDTLSEHLDGNPFYFNSQKIDIYGWIFRCVLPQAIEDANSIIVELPSIKGNEGLIPADFDNSANEAITLDTLLIPSSRVVVHSKDVFGWLHGTAKYGEKKGETAPFYFFVDMEAYYRYIPYKDEDGKLKYKLEPWYVHSDEDSTLDRLPITKVPGRIKNYSEYSDKGELEYQYKYQESYLAPAFEILNEVLISFNNDQGIRGLHGNPKLVVEDTVCETCRGDLTTEYFDEGVKKSKPCGTCKGSGVSPNPGAFGVYQRGAKGYDEKGGDVYKYIDAPTFPLEHSWKVWRALLEDAKRAVGLDLLEGTGVESGEAKKERENTLKDLLKEYWQDIHYMLENVLWIKEQMLVLNEDLRTKPVIPHIVDFELRSVDELRETASNSNAIDFKDANIRYLKSMYRNNSVKIKAYELAMDYAPLLKYDKDQWDTLLNEKYSGDDICRHDHAIRAFEEILSDERNINKPTKELFELADQWFIDNGYIQEQILELGEVLEEGGVIS